MELQDALTSWQQTFDSIEDSIVIIDKKFEILQANRTTFDMFGDSIIGKKCYEVFHNNDNQINECPCVGMMKGENCEKIEVSGPFT